MPRAARDRRAAWGHAVVGHYASRVGMQRQCTKTGCSRPAVATLTYVYRDQTAVLGPLATFAEPHTYDLCLAHAGGLTAPRGWEVVRLVPEADVPPGPVDDLLAIADAVRERPDPRVAVAASAAPQPATRPAPPTTRAHLRLVRD